MPRRLSSATLVMSLAHRSRYSSGPFKNSLPLIDGAGETACRTIRDGNRASDVITRLRALFKRKTVVAEPFDLNEATRGVTALWLTDLQRSTALNSSRSPSWSHTISRCCQEKVPFDDSARSVERWSAHWFAIADHQNRSQGQSLRRSPRLDLSCELSSSTHHDATTDCLTAASISPSKFPDSLSAPTLGFYKISILHAAPFHRRFGFHRLVH